MEQNKLYKYLNFSKKVDRYIFENLPKSKKKILEKTWELNEKFNDYNFIKLSVPQFIFPPINLDIYLKQLSRNKETIEKIISSDASVKKEHPDVTKILENVSNIINNINKTTQNIYNTHK